MKNSMQLIEEFVALKKIAVVGVSRDHDKMGNAIYTELKQRGKTVFPVNPSADMVEGDRCYAGVGALPEKAEGVLLVIPPEATLQVIRDTAGEGIPYVWLQQGANSVQGEKLAQELGLKLISGECIFMYNEPVKSIHRFHRGIRKLFGGLPK